MPPRRRRAARSAASAVAELRLAETLTTFEPRVATTLGTGLETPKSDLDVVCRSSSAQAFHAAVSEAYDGSYALELGPAELPTWVRFRAADGLRIELYADRPETSRQNAVVHARAHRRLLSRYGDRLRRRIRALKLAGLATEPAFALELGLAGDPYEALRRLGEAEPDRWLGALRELRRLSPRKKRRTPPRRSASHR